jgi:antitoxin HicB
MTTDGDAMLQYPVRLILDDNDTILVEFPDIPEAVTFGATAEEALLRAQDALATAIEGYIKDRREIPTPSRMAGLRVRPSALVAAKVDLYRTMRAQHVSKADLGRRLSWHQPQVDRLLDVHHSSRLDQLEAAFRALGKRLFVAAEEARPVRVTRVARRRAARGRRTRVFARKGAKKR